MKQIGYWVGAGLLVVSTVICWPANPFDLSFKKLEIPKGSSVRSVQLILKENKILPRITAFRLVIRLFGLQNDVKAGEYTFSPSDPLPRIIVKLLTGETAPPRQIRVTFPEGTSIYKMGIILKDNGFDRWQDFQGLVSEGITASLREKHWSIFKYVPSESLEGYLFPDTYQVFKTLRPRCWPRRCFSASKRWCCLFGRNRKMIRK